MRDFMNNYLLLSRCVVYLKSMWGNVPKEPCTSKYNMAYDVQRQYSRMRVCVCVYVGFLFRQLKGNVNNAAKPRNNLI